MLVHLDRRKLCHRQTSAESVHIGWVLGLFEFLN